MNAMLIQTVIMETFVKFNGTNVFQDLILVILLLVERIPFARLIKESSRLYVLAFLE